MESALKISKALQGHPKRKCLEQRPVLYVQLKKRFQETCSASILCNESGVEFPDLARVAGLLAMSTGVFVRCVCPALV